MVQQPLGVAQSRGVAAARRARAEDRLASGAASNEPYHEEHEEQGQGEGLAELVVVGNLKIHYELRPSQ